MAVLAIAPWMVNLLIVGFLFLCVLMVLLILIQRPQGGGLAGAFGASSGGAGQTVFGTKTGDALTMATITVFVIYLLVAIGLVFAARPENIGAARGPAVTVPGAPPATPDPSTAPSTTPTTTGGTIDEAPSDQAPVTAPEPNELAPVEQPTPEVPAGTPEDGGR